MDYFNYVIVEYLDNYIIKKCNIKNKINFNDIIWKFDGLKIIKSSRNFRIVDKIDFKYAGYAVFKNEETYNAAVLFLDKLKEYKISIPYSFNNKIPPIEIFKIITVYEIKNG